MDDLLELLYRPVAGGGMLYMEFFAYAIAGFFVLLGVLTAVTTFRRNRLQPADDNYRRVQCATCGWEGMVSKYVRTCPKCNDTNFVSHG